MKFNLSVVLCVGATLAMGQNDKLTGAWSYNDGKNEEVHTYVSGIFSVAVFSVANKEFVSTYGGKYEIKGSDLVVKFEYNTATPSVVGTELKINFDQKGNELTLSSTDRRVLKRLDDGTPGKLAGAWLITGRMRDNAISRSTPGARRTMKILSGTRFQWIAYNVDTKEFFGTGGGTYTTVDGKYTENIEFFSRDATRVGASLTFDYSLPDGEWRHQGKSSKGDPLDEIWTKREKIGL